MPDLGSYAFEVLSAYAVTLTLLGILVLWSIRQSRKVSRELTEVEARREKRSG